MLAIRKAKSLFTVVLTIAIAFATCHAFAEDAYIESDGTSGILTGYKLKPTSRVAVDFALTTTEQVSGARLFGADRSHTALKMSGSFYIGGGENTLWVIHLGNGGEKYDNVWPKDGNGDFITLDTDRHTIVIDYPNPPHLYITGSVTNEVPNEDFTPESFTNEAIEPIALFARQNASGAFEKQCKARIFGVKIYESGALVHDFAPCLKDGMPGFKDIAGDGGFLCNPSAETAFTYGGDILVEESPYVATPAGNNTDADKHLYIDTEYYATADTRLELDYALTEERPSGATWYVFSGESQFGAFINDKGAGFVVKASQWKTGVAPSVANRVGVKRTAILDVPGTWCGLVTGTCTNDHKSITTNGAFASTSTIKLGSYAGANNYFASMKIYGCRIYEAGTLVRDFRPCVFGPLDLDGTPVVGLKDEVTGTFISYPAATALKRLSCGGKMELPSYVETLRTDSRYIDTGYLVTANTKVAIDYAPTEEKGSGDTWYLFAAKDTDNFAAYINDRGFGFINSSSWKMDVGADVGASSVNVRRTVILDNPANKGAIVTEGVTNATCATTAGGPFSRLTLRLGTQVGAVANCASIRIYGCKIWEKENGEYVLKRDYVPAVENNVAGLRDATGSDTTFRVCASTAASPLTYGGAFTPVVAPTAAKVTHGNTVTLTATSPGATSYRWFRNGEEIPGATSSSLLVRWRRDGETDTYAARSAYAVDAATIESGESESVAVENVTPGLILIVR